MRPLLALIILAIFLLVAFLLRMWLHRHRTGSWGFHGISGPAGSAAWWGGILFIAAPVLLISAPVLTLAGIERPRWSPSLVQDLTGGAAAVLGIAGTLWSQAAMGRSWRIGVRAGERTDLVQSGPFAWVRNPIFTAMILGAAGFTLLLPTLSAIAGLVSLVVGLELQVRLVEEPHLIAIHGDAYVDYGRRVGRFVPLLGRFHRSRRLPGCG